VLDGAEMSEEKEKHPAVATVRGRALPAVAHVRGATSASYAKKSYSIKFPGAELGVAEWHAGETRNHLILTTTFDDTAYVRQKLVFDLWRAMAAHVGAHRLAPKTFFAVLYLNGAYHGLYTACDRIDDEFLRGAGFPSGEGSPGRVCH
jgi:hypothetical protein